MKAPFIFQTMIIPLHREGGSSFTFLLHVHPTIFRDFLETFVFDCPSEIELSLGLLDLGRSNYLKINFLVVKEGEYFVFDTNENCSSAEDIATEFACDERIDARGSTQYRMTIDSLRNMLSHYTVMKCEINLKPYEGKVQIAMCAYEGLHEDVFGYLTNETLVVQTPNDKAVYSDLMSLFTEERRTAELPMETSDGEEENESPADEPI